MQESRHNQLIEQIKRQKIVKISELVKQYQVSRNTIHNDLKELALQGIVKKKHGGAVFIEPEELKFPAPRSDKSSYRKVANIEKKQQLSNNIKKHLLEHCPGNPLTIFMDGSTTCLQVAEILKDVPAKIMVVTNYPELLHIFDNCSNISVILLGGLFWQSEAYTIGKLTLDMIQLFYVDVAILGVASIELANNVLNTYDSNQEIIAIKQHMMKRAKETWIACDTTKFEKRSIAYFCNTNELDKIFTDSKPLVYDSLPPAVQKKIYFE